MEIKKKEMRETKPKGKKEGKDRMKVRGGRKRKREKGGRKRESEEKERKEIKERR